MARDVSARRALVPPFLLSRLLLVALLGLLMLGIIQGYGPHVASPLFRLVLTFVYVAVAAALVARARQQALAAEAGTLTPADRGVRNLLVHVLVIATYVYVAIVAADGLHLSLAGFAFGGAVTGIVLGLAAQSTLGNLFAGLLLLVLRPYVPGQWVALRSWYSSGIEYQGWVREVNLFYTVLDQGLERRVIPNAAAVVSYVTVVGDGSRRAFETSLPRSVSLEAIEERFRRLVGAVPELHVVGLAPDSYTVTVVLPEGQSSAWEAVLADFVRESSGAEPAPPE